MIRASDFERSLRFYKSGLGFKEILSWGVGDKRGVVLGTEDTPCVELFVGGSDSPQEHGNIEHVAFHSTDCEASYQAALAAGAGARMAPRNIALATIPAREIRIAFCTGPDGEIIEFWQDI